MLVDFQTRGNFVESFVEHGAYPDEKNQRMVRQSMKKVTDPQWTESIRKSLAKSNWDFRFYLVDKLRIIEEGYTSDLISDNYLTAHRDFPSIGTEIYEKMDGNITFILSNNVTTENNYIPLTGWILVHRMMHVLFGFEESDDILKMFYKPYRHHTQITDNIAYATHNDFRRKHMVWSDRFHSWIVSVLSMKSARNNKLNKINLDLSAELATQYALTNDIKFNSTGVDIIDEMLENIRQDLIKMFHGRFKFNGWKNMQVLIKDLNLNNQKITELLLKYPSTVIERASDILWLPDSKLHLKYFDMIRINFVDYEVYDIIDGYEVLMHTIPQIGSIELGCYEKFDDAVDAVIDYYEQFHGHR